MLCAQRPIRCTTPGAGTTGLWAAFPAPSSAGFAAEFSLELAVDIEALDVEGTRAFLQERLAALLRDERRQPIPDREPAALCAEPVDRLGIRWSRNRPSPGGNGTRFWRLETLATAVSEGRQCASGN